MSVPKEGNWLDALSFGDGATSGELDQAVLVDIGGNVGHQCTHLKVAHPELARRIMLRDRIEKIKSAPEIKGVNFMAQDLFTLQTVKGTVTSMLLRSREY
jgi:hypothetical protein